MIGGGDWAKNRIIPDAIRALSDSQPVPVRNPRATRPWQHVLEPLSGYLCIAQALSDITSESINSNPICSAFNFGPKLEANRSVQQLIEESLKHWNGKWIDQSDKEAPHEAERLSLQIEKAQNWLGWEPNWNFEETIERTITWYREIMGGADPYSTCLRNVEEYNLMNQRRY